ncbi:MAG: hypothetical protein Q7S36_01815, partial [Candidatus Liptonbacteria bacterium]|nr:hypothetical protein [Candidatus Liptonbacteria bacterium]
MKQFFIRILSFLRVKPVVGGLEISDSALHFAILSGKNLKSAGLRLPPGVVVGGQIKDREQFVGALRALHYQILGEEKNRNRISVIISLSSIGIYTQVFNLPMLEGESLEKAVELNIQMISPLDFAEAYSGWQFAKKDTEKSRLEVLSAFVSRNVVDEFVSALGEGGFLAVAIESHALSLARLLKDAGKDFDATKPYIMLSIDGGGLDILIIRHEQLHFDYFNSWRDIQGDAKEISADAFKAAVIRSLHQVVNFSNSHWREPVTEILFTATGFKDEAVKIIEENFSLKTRTFELSMGQAVAPDWFVALGASARGQKPRRSDNEISLLGINAREEFGREQVLGFLRFWRILMPAAIAIFLVAFFGTNLAL